jgi:SAM-dependent methyltransferase
MPGPTSMNYRRPSGAPGSAARPSAFGTLIRRARLYDAFVAVLTFGRERRFREAILDLVEPTPGDIVLDVGCGTGTLAALAKQRVGQDGQVEGIDASPEMVALANAKAASNGGDVQYQEAFAQALPFEDSTFDIVLCTMVLHHLPNGDRAEAIAETHRVLRPGGRLLVVDLAQTSGLLSALSPIALVHGRRGLDTADQAKRLIEDRGFEDVATGELGFRSMGYVLARKPRSE